MAIKDHDEITVETFFCNRRIEVEEFIELYNEIKNSLKFFYNKIEYHANCYRTKPSMLGALIEFLKDEIKIFNYELKSYIKYHQEDFLLPSAKRPDLYVILNSCDKIIEMREIDDYPPYIVSEFNSLRKLLGETQGYLTSPCLSDLFYTPANIEEKFNALMEKYEKEHLERLKIYIEDFESADAVKASLRQEYKDDKAVKCWKDSAHNVEKTIRAMYKAKYVENDLLPLFEYIIKCKMLEWKFGWQRTESEINAAKSNLVNRNTMINIYDCPSINIGQAQDIISDGGIKNIYNRKKL